MNLWETFRVAARAIWRHGARSFLTALGLVIGVAAVITVVAIGEGAKAQVQESFAAMGTNLLIVLPGSTNAGGVKGGFGTQPSITWDDLKAIQTEVPTVRAAAPTQKSTQVLSDDQNWLTQVTGTTLEYFEVRAIGERRAALCFNKATSTPPTKSSCSAKPWSTSCMVPTLIPSAKSCASRTFPLPIVGVLERKDQSQMGQDYDDAAFVPIQTFAVTKIQGGLRAFDPGRADLCERHFRCT